jgi:hypothetical protein
MNEQTLVSCHGYSGDAPQVRILMQYLRHHQCPVVVVSPENAPLNARNVPGMGLAYRTGGVKAYIGQQSLDRQIEHMRLLLKFPQNWFLMNDSDSVCLSPELPRYLYDEDVFWSNVVSDEMHDRSGTPGYKWPRLAFQPPYFCSRKILEQLVAIGPKYKADPQTPFIDHCLMMWSIAGNIPYKNFPNGCSCPTRDYEQGMKHMSDMVRFHGSIMLHSIKNAEALSRMAWSRVEWKRLQKSNPR